MESSGRLRGNDMGPTGEVVAYNVRRLRRELGFDLRRLSVTLRQLNRPISASGLSKIENGQRKVDADDLVALAVALNVNPNALLLHPTTVGGHLLAITGCANPIEAGEAWAWARGERPLGYGRSHAGIPEEQIDEHRKRVEQSFIERVSPGFPQYPGPGAWHYVKDEPQSAIRGHRVRKLVPIEPPKDEDV